MMQSLDAMLFQVMTAGPQAPVWLVLFARLAATWVVPLVAVGLFLAFLMRRARADLLDAVASALLGLAVVQGIGWIAYRPRPFELGQGLNLLHHLPENSFPSDHATLMFALAASLILARRPAGSAILALALVVGWSRVYLGAHWPGDILGGALLGLACAVVLRTLKVRHAVWIWLQHLHDAILAHIMGRIRRT